MKSILISIRPEWVAKIANGEKKIEIRRSKPKRELPIDVLIYCTKGKPLTRLGTLWNGDRKTDVFSLSYPPNATYNGKVVGKFRLNEIAEYQIQDAKTWSDSSFEETTKTLMGLSLNELQSYADGKPFFGWIISDLEIFDEPKSLEEFGLKRAPQSWRYVEVEE